MSRFSQTTIAPVAGSAKVKFFVNVYKDAAGNIEPGSKTYRTLVNAQRKARSARGLTHVGVRELEISLP